MPTSSDDDWVDRAAAAVDGADALLLCAGAGMGVDSGLPDFRGNEGFWHAYPPYRDLAVSFMNMANPAWFRRDPHFAWGFYGHRRNLYRETKPHDGFAILRRWGEAKPGGCFVFTSNVDHQFQRAGFSHDQILECHGSIEYSQCMLFCGAGVVDADEATLEIETKNMKAVDPLPQCPQCGALTRPNILMFGDGDWDGSRCQRQVERMNDWFRERQGQRVVIIECGAGTGVPTVRMNAESYIDGPDSLIRLNPREPEVPHGQLGVPIGALAGLEQINARRGG